MESLDMESDELNAQAEAPLWRQLPTAWIHMVIVECAPIYLAVFAWLRLIANVNLRTAMGSQFELSSRLEGYFYYLFLFGSTESTTTYLPNVTDTFFLGHAQKSESVFYNGTMLTLPATSIDGANIPWIVLVWLLPAGAALLLLLYFVVAVKHGIWSFDSGEYLHFSWDIIQAPEYKWCVGLMSLAAILLPVLWTGQILAFNLQDQWRVLQGSILSGVLLLFALNQLAFPNVPRHDWGSDFKKITFRRPFLHLFLGTNKSFALKLIDALWAAQHGDASRLRRYLVDANLAPVVLQICSEAQEAERMHRAGDADESE